MTNVTRLRLKVKQLLCLTLSLNDMIVYVRKIFSVVMTIKLRTMSLTLFVIIDALEVISFIIIIFHLIVILTVVTANF